MVALVSAMAANAAEPAKPAQAAEPSDTEEITVYGTRTIAALRAKMMDTELRFYDLFNALNDEPKFAIHCQVVATTGTLIKQRECSAQFADDIRADQAWASESDIPWIPPMDEIERNNKEFRQRIEKHLRDSKDLLTVAREYRTLRQQVLDAEKANEKGNRTK
jgi:hypothetical protein